jgi:ketosteroid isomerase-like protein
MHKRIVLALLGLGCLSTGGLTMASDEASLRAFVARGPQVLSSDFEAWAAGYHPDWSYWRLGAAETRARAEHMPLVRANMEGGMQIEDFEIEIVDMLVNGGVGYVRYNAVEHLRLAGGEKREVRFSAASLYTHENGEWQVLRSSLSYLPQ